MEEGGVERALLISDAYLEEGAERFRLNEELSAFVAGAPGRYRGLCGLNTAWSDGDEVLERCLALPGMIGIKLHFRWFHQSLSSPETAARFESLASIADGRRGTFLIHMNLEKDAAGELSALREVARRHPRSRFVIAHAAESALDALAASGGVENLYTEVSTFVIRDPSEVSAALRGFGIGRVLFGVDGPGYGSKRTIERFLALPLTDAAKTAVLETNGAAFWESLPR